jgi:hypothetical protein
MRSFLLVGWEVRDEYEFLVNLWKLNKTLSADKQIRVVPTDEQAPWKLLRIKEDFDKWEENSMDRNTRMADVIEQTIKTKIDKRNCLFVVGQGHAYKSHVPGLFSTRKGQEPALSAAAQLVQRLSNEKVFTVFQHTPIGNNNGNLLGLIRQGLFDVSFEKNGNNPVAFHLAGSPFGTEPFDADYDMCFDSRAGNFVDNFDGYIFLQPLKDEEDDCMLYEIYSDEFVGELKRRAAFFNRDANQWFGIEGELTKEKIIEPLKEACEGKKSKKWSELFE